jgi:hypothetical protein
MNFSFELTWTLLIGHFTHFLYITINERKRSRTGRKRRGWAGIYITSVSRSTVVILMPSVRKNIEIIFFPVLSTSFSRREYELTRRNAQIKENQSVDTWSDS